MQSNPDSGYQYQVLSNGNRRRQLGGAPNPRIAEAFANPDYPARPYVKKRIIDNGIPIDKWGVEPSSWFEYLNVTPMDVVEQCKAAGVADPDTLEILQSWGTDMYRTAIGRRARKDEEIPDLYADELPAPALLRAQNYDKEVTKAGVRQLYERCQITKPSRIKNRERSMCQTLMCQDDFTDSAGNPQRRLVLAPEDLPEVIASNPGKEGRYKRCASIGIANCAGRITRHTYNANDFTYIPNPGSGECLFIAVAHYRYLVGSMGGYIEPGTNDDGIPDDSIEPLTNLETHMYTKTGKLVLHEAQRALRQQTVEWLSDHRNDQYVSLDGTIREEICRIVADSILIRRALPRARASASATALAGVDEYRFLPTIQSLPIATRKLLGLTGVNSKDLAAKVLDLINDDPADPAELTAAFLQARDLLFDKLFQQYLTVMSKQSTYAGQPEIMGLAHVLDLSIIILQRSGNEDELTSNMGTTLPGRDTMYIYHNQNVTGVDGSLHYEALLPVKYTKLRDIDGVYAMSKMVADVMLDEPVLKNVTNYEEYNESVAHELLSNIDDQSAVTAIASHYDEVRSVEDIQWIYEFLEGKLIQLALNDSTDDIDIINALLMSLNADLHALIFDGLGDILTMATQGAFVLPTDANISQHIDKAIEYHNLLSKIKIPPLALKLHRPPTDDAEAAEVAEAVAQAILTAIASLLPVVENWLTDERLKDVYIGLRRILLLSYLTNKEIHVKNGNELDARDLTLTAVLKHYAKSADYVAID